MFTDALRAQATDLLAQLQRKGLKLATAESCTGGLIAALITEIPGSSAVFERGYVTYSNDAKYENLGVEKSLVDEQGAVSEPVAAAMAQGALARSRADIALSVTGIAGPGGGTKEKPVGLVYLAVATKDNLRTYSFHFTGSRADIRLASVERAISLLLAEMPNLQTFIA